MFSIVWKLIILYLCESNIEFYMRVKEIPILLLTGYLGSGKTTLVNHILSNKRGIKFAVIVNDIGEVNIDADLIQRGGIVGKKDESLVALQNGCICCTLKMDLVEQIDDKAVPPQKGKRGRERCGKNAVFAVPETPAAKNRTDYKQEEPGEEGEIVRAEKPAIHQPEGVQPPTLHDHCAGPPAGEGEGKGAESGER